MPIRVENADDPAVAEFRDIRERDLVGRTGRFIAEGTVVLNMLAAAHGQENGFRAEKILVLENRLAGIADTLNRFPWDVPVYTASAAVIDAIAGFHLHRGVLALGRKPEPRPLDEALTRLPERALVTVLSGISNHDNAGAIFRNSAAFRRRSDHSRRNQLRPPLPEGDPRFCRFRAHRPLPQRRQHRRNPDEAGSGRLRRLGPLARRKDASAHDS